MESWTCTQTPAPRVDIWWDVFFLPSLPRKAERNLTCVIPSYPLQSNLERSFIRYKDFQVKVNNCQSRNAKPAASELSGSDLRWRPPRNRIYRWKMMEKLKRWIWRKMGSWTKRKKKKKEHLIIPLTKHVAERLIVSCSVWRWGCARRGPLTSRIYGGKARTHDTL